MSLTGQPLNKKTCSPLPDGTLSSPMNLLAEEYTIVDSGVVVPLYDETFLWNWIPEMAMCKVRKGYDVVIVITGMRRRGKSHLGLKILQAINAKATADCIHLKLSEFIDAYEQSPYADPKNGFYPVLIEDEIGFGANSKLWYERMQINMNRLFQVTGIKGIISILIAPDTAHINKDLLGMAEHWFHVWDDHLNRGQCHYSEPTEGRFNTNWWNDRYEFTYSDLPKDDPLLLAYNAKKIAFTNESFNIIKEDTKKHEAAKGQRHDSYFEKVLTDLMARTGENPFKIAKRLGLDDGLVYKKLGRGQEGKAND